MPRWTPKSGAERVRQALKDKRAMLERANVQSRPAEVLHGGRGMSEWPTHSWDSTASATISGIHWTPLQPVTAYAWHGTAESAFASTTYHYQGNALWDWATTINEHIVSYGSATAWQPFEPVEPLTQEEADRRLAATRHAAHKSAIRRRKAIKKGRKLLLEVLTEAQQQEYARTKAFTVTGADGKIYKLRKGGTTHQIDESGLAILSHCIHLPYSYIDEDTLVAVKMLLENDPKEFLKIANTSRLAPSLGISVPGLPQEMEDRAAALAGGIDAINMRFNQLSIAAAHARDDVRRMGRAYEEAGEAFRATVNVWQARIDNAHDYGDYARELEHQVVAEETGGLVLPQAARQQHAARLLGHMTDISGAAVAA